MNISGILVMAEPEHTGDTVELLKTLPGIDVHYVDNTTGRIVITQEAETITRGLESIKEEIEQGKFQLKAELEDIHMNIEARLMEKVGEVGGKLHTARSRNDQVS